MLATRYAAEGVEEVVGDVTEKVMGMTQQHIVGSEASDDEECKHEDHDEQRCEHSKAAAAAAAAAAHDKWLKGHYKTEQDDQWLDYDPWPEDHHGERRRVVR